MRLTRFLLKAAKTPKKPDPMNDWRWQVSGLTMDDLKHHYSIIPIHLMTLGALFMAGAYVVRLATKHPEVSWTKANPEPWEEYRNRQYKFIDSGRDYTKPSMAPRYKDT